MCINCLSCSGSCFNYWNQGEKPKAYSTPPRECGIRSSGCGGGGNQMGPGDNPWWTYLTLFLLPAPFSVFSHYLSCTYNCLFSWISQTPRILLRCLTSSNSSRSNTIRIYEGEMCFLCSLIKNKEHLILFCILYLAFWQIW